MPPLRSILLLHVTSTVSLILTAGCSQEEPASRSGGVEVPITAAPIETMEDPRLASLLTASERWRTMRGPRRDVVDQLVLAPDTVGFLAALAAWDSRSFHPILIDDPQWTIPFVKAFRPTRIIRTATGRRGPTGEFDEWSAAETAIRRSWREGDSDSERDLPPSGTRPTALGPTPPGLVVSHPGSSSLVGAAALAAGRFQPLIRLDPPVADADSKGRTLGFDDRLSEDQAIDLALRFEHRVALAAPDYAKLGDDVDFLTLAGDWPFRYSCLRGSGLSRGDRAVDDLIGRNLERGRIDLDSAWTRWAYAGRLLGDAPASAYRAMGSLFLQPESALLWNTYGEGRPWSEYDVGGAATILRLIRPSAAVDSHSGDRADLAAWHAMMRRPNGRDLLLLNSSGAPDRFSISGGPGVPGDLPFGASLLVSMIHSFSAASPKDPATIAGRFLDRGTFLYYGSMNEPFLTAFRTPYLLSLLSVAETPLAAALRQGPGEAFGRPWRLVYLGDPLYHIDGRFSWERPARTAPDDPPPGSSPLRDHPRPADVDAAATLDWCYDATLLALARGEETPPGLLDLLVGLNRERLDRRRLAILDELLIDRSLAIGDLEGLVDRLLHIPGRSRTSRVWQAIETSTFALIADRLGRDRFDEATDLWFRIVVGPWPPHQDFPAEISRRLTAAAGPAHHESLRRRLIDAQKRLASQNILPERRRLLADILRDLDRSRPR